MKLDANTVVRFGADYASNIYLGSDQIWEREYHPNSIVLFDRFTTLGEEPSLADKLRYDNIMRIVYPMSNLMRFYLQASHGPLSSKVEWLIPNDDTRDLIPVAGSSEAEPTFLQYRGRTGGTANGGYDTTLNPTVADRGITMGQDNACMGIFYPQGAGASAGGYSNGNLNFSMVPRHHNGSTAIGQAIVRVNTTTATTLANNTSTTSNHHFYLERSASNVSDLYVDNVRMTNPSVSSASSGRSNFTMGVCGRKTAATPTWQFDYREQGAAYFGRNLSANDRTALHNALVIYMKAIGAIT